MHSRKLRGKCKETGGFESFFVVTGFGVVRCQGSVMMRELTFGVVFAASAHEQRVVFDKAGGFHWEQGKTGWLSTKYWGFDCWDLQGCIQLIYECSKAVKHLEDRWFVLSFS